MKRFTGFVVPILVLTAFATLPNVVHAQETLGRPSNRRSSETGDISPATMLRELKARGIDPLDSNANHNLRLAYISYEFEAGQGKNLNSNQEDISKALEKLNTGLAETALSSHVKVRTPRPGARVWYTLVGSGGKHPFNQLTNNSEDDLPIGIYFIWSEREGKVTSSKQIPFRIIQAAISVDLEETR